MKKELRTSTIVGLIQNARGRRLGKTQLQKLVYFVQERGVPLGYTYELYHYGPYSFELSNELSSLDSLGVLSIESDPEGFGFDISIGKFADKFVLDPHNEGKLKKIIDHFGSNSTAQLEVKATIHFVHSVIKRKSVVGKRRSEVINRVHDLKPRYSEDFIKNCYSELEQTHWIA
jgi:uncharacterized protein YwgA